MSHSTKNVVSHRCAKMTFLMGARYCLKIEDPHYGSRLYFERDNFKKSITPSRMSRHPYQLSLLSTPFMSFYGWVEGAYNHPALRLSSLSLRGRLKTSVSKKMKTESTGVVAERLHQCQHVIYFLKPPTYQ